MSINKNSRLVEFNSTNPKKRKWFMESTNTNISQILIDYYDQSIKKNELILSSADIGLSGEDFTERILKKYNYNYTRTSACPHSGDFIINNKVLLDSKNYKSNINKEQIIKIKYDMNIRKIKYGIILLFTESNINIEIKENIILISCPENEEYVNLLLNIIINFINSLTINNDLSFICINHELSSTINSYNEILIKIENIKNSFNLIINDLYKNNVKLREILSESLFVKSEDNNDINDILCDDSIKKILKSISYEKLNVNGEKLLLNFKNNIDIIIDYKSKNNGIIKINNFNILNKKNIYNELLLLMNNIQMNISNEYIYIYFNYNTNILDDIIQILQLIILS
tara:strand:+ start:1373 stop:2401 length:1029 start_codon:yes stop_codon:yes gene_type:complete